MRPCFLFIFSYQTRRATTNFPKNNEKGIGGVLFIVCLILSQVVIGMDVAASEFYNDKDQTYDLNFKEEVKKKKSAMIYLFNWG